MLIYLAYPTFTTSLGKVDNVQLHAYYTLIYHWGQINDRCDGKQKVAEAYYALKLIIH